MARLIEDRRTRLEELVKWARTQPTAGIKSRVRDRAKSTYFVSEMTARDYANTVVEVLKAEQKPIPA